MVVHLVLPAMIEQQQVKIRLATTCMHYLICSLNIVAIFSNISDFTVYVMCVGDCMPWSPPVVTQYTLDYFEVSCFHS